MKRGRVKGQSMLSEQQIDHFRTFGFLLLPQLFTADEIGEIRRAADELWREERGGGPSQGEYQHVAPFIESSRDLSGLVEDDRIYLTIRQLLGRRFRVGRLRGQQGQLQ